MNAISALNDRPNLGARSLSTSRSSIIGVAPTRLDDEFYPKFLEELSMRLSGHAARVLLFVTGTAADLDPLLDELLAFHLDAPVRGSSSLSSRLAQEGAESGIRS